MVGFLLITASSALAGLVPVEFCIRYDLNYTDASTGDFLDATPNTDKAARGILLRFVRPNGSYFGYFMDWEGGDKGCKDIWLDDSIAYTVKVVSRASVNGNTIKVVNATTTSNNEIASTILTNYTPVVGPHPNSPFIVGPAPRYNIIAAASKALQRHNAGVTGETFKYVMLDCPISGGPACDRHVNLGHLYVDPVQNADNFKFVVVHELGHALGDVRDEGNDSSNVTNAAMDDCQFAGTSTYIRSAHHINSKEYQSNAAVEGFANFYAAYTFNKHDVETDCQYFASGVDWDLSGAVVFGEPAVFDCDDTGVAWGSVDGDDFYGDYCSFTGTQTNRGTELDWMRHFWSLVTVDGFSMSDVVDIWDEADPHDWNGDDAGNVADFPAARMSTAASTVGGTTMFNDYVTSAAVNGVDL